VVLRPNDMPGFNPKQSSGSSSSSGGGVNGSGSKLGNSNKNSFIAETVICRTILQVSAGMHSSLVLLQPVAASGSGTADASSASPSSSTARGGSTEVWQLGFGSPSPMRVSFAVKAKPTDEDAGFTPARSRSPSTGTSTNTSSDANPKPGYKLAATAAATDSVKSTRERIHACSTRRAVTIVQVSAGRTDHVALSSVGHVYTWGAGSDFLGHEAVSWYGAASKEAKVLQRYLSNPQLVETLLPGR